MTIRVGVFGAGGRMGRAVAHAINAAEGMRLVAAVDPSFEGIHVGEVTGVTGCDFSVVSSAESLVDNRGTSSDLLVDVMVDFTHVDAARRNVAFCAANGIHAVVGTSGFTEADYGRIGESFTDSNCLIAPNFAIGAVLMIRFAELAAPYFQTAEIIELHHDNKVDAPSGTAISTAERIAAAGGEWATDPTETVTIAGARGAKGPSDIAIHSVRMRGMIAHQEVLMGTTGQTLTLRHDSYDRSSFMPGVVLGVRRIGEVPGLTVGLDRILDL